MKPAESCWVLSDGNAGNENPCLGLAEALGAETTVKRVVPRAPWSWLPPRLWFAALSAPGPGGDRPAPPWPGLLIACGRRTAALSAAIRAAGGGHTFTIQLLDPKLPPDWFDLVVAPRHDRLTGANVIETLGALNRVTTERLADAAGRLAASVTHLPRPRVAVLVGGASKRHRMTARVADDLGASLARLAGEHGAGLMVTASRRTGDANAARLRRRLDGMAAVMWDGSGGNPYFGYLGLADAIVVTGDSVAMVSEACATGKPVHVYHLPGGSAKFDRFHEALRAAGCARSFSGALEDWSYPPLRETARVADVARRRMRDEIRGEAWR